MIFRSTPPRWSSSHATSAWSAGVVAEDVGRRVVEQRLRQLDDPLEVVLPAVVGVDVALAVPADLLVVELLVVGQQEVVAVVHRVRTTSASSAA